MNVVNWIEDWYRRQCDGEWEHEYGVRIYTLDNPGWSIQIDLRYTELESLEMEWRLVERAEDDWYGLKIENAQFSAAGDPSKLNVLLDKFREIAEEVTEA